MSLNKIGISDEPRFIRIRIHITSSHPYSSLTPIRQGSPDFTKKELLHKTFSYDLFDVFSEWLHMMWAVYELQEMHEQAILSTPNAEGETLSVEYQNAHATMLKALQQELLPRKAALMEAGFSRDDVDALWQVVDMEVTYEELEVGVYEVAA